jgi:hypothetical protein
MRELFVFGACALVVACFKDDGGGGGSGPGTTQVDGTDAGVSTTGGPTAPTSSAGPTTDGGGPTTGEPPTGAPTTGEPMTGSTTEPLPDCPGGEMTVLAVDQLLVGDTNPDGTANAADGWRQYGLDIDGRDSVATATDLCQPVEDAKPATVYPDGDGGIDNSFGKQVLPLLLALDNEFGAELNARVDAGEFTYLLAISGLGDQPACTTASELSLGAPLGAMPVLDGSDVWPVDPASLSDPADPTTALCQYSETSVVDGHVVTGPPGRFDLILGFGQVPIRVPLHHARLVLELAPDRKSATGGHISGILSAAEFSERMAMVAAQFDPAAFCDPNSATLQSVLTQIRQASDILLDGTQDPGKPCDGISLGFGFTMKQVQLGGVGPALPPPDDPCD